jgi:hypothetical protein
MKKRILFTLLASMFMFSGIQAGTVEECLDICALYDAPGDELKWLACVTGCDISESR